MVKVHYNKVARQYEVTFTDKNGDKHLWIYSKRENAEYRADMCRREVIA